MKKLLFAIFLLSLNLCYAEIIPTEIKAKVAQLLAEKNFNEAAQVLQKASLQDPSNVEIKTQLVDVQIQRRAFVDAINLLNELKTAQPNNANYPAKLVEIQSLNKKYQDAINLSETIEVDKIDGVENKVNYLVSLAKAHNGINHWPNEIKVLKQAVSIDPNNLQLVLSMAKAYANLDNYNEAMPYFEKFAAATKVTEANLAYDLGLYFYNGSNFKKSAEFMTLAKDLGYKTNLNYYYNLANIYYDAKDFNNCLINLQESKKISPFDHDVNNLIAYTYYETNRLKEAREIIKEMLDITPNDADLIYFYGQTYLKADDKYTAEKYFEKAIKMNPSLEKMRSSTMKL
jgi:tetratricopeptide (TPR) repeat protein